MLQCSKNMSGLASGNSVAIGNACRRGRVSQGIFGATLDRINTIGKWLETGSSGQSELTVPSIGRAVDAIGDSALSPGQGHSHCEKASNDV